MRACAPGAAVHRSLLGCAQHPTERGRVLVQSPEHPDAARGRAGEEAVHLGQGQGLVAQKHDRRAARLGRLEHRAAVAEQGRRIALSQAYRLLRQLEVRFEMAVLRVDRAGGEPGLGGGLQHLLGRLGARHHQDDGLGHVA